MQFLIRVLLKVELFFLRRSIYALYLTLYKLSLISLGVSSRLLVSASKLISLRSF